KPLRRAGRPVRLEAALLADPPARREALEHRYVVGVAGGLQLRQVAEVGRLAEADPAADLAGSGRVEVVEGGASPRGGGLALAARAVLDHRLLDAVPPPP